MDNIPASAVLRALLGLVRYAVHVYVRLRSLYIAAAVVVSTNTSASWMSKLHDCVRAVEL